MKLYDYYTLCIVDGEKEIVEHDSRKDAEIFARELAEEGYFCQVLHPLSSFFPNRKPKSLEDYYGVTPGIDFPATL